MSFSARHLYLLAPLAIKQLIPPSSLSLCRSPCSIYLRSRFSPFLLVSLSLSLSLVPSGIFSAFPSSSRYLLSPSESIFVPFSNTYAPSFRPSSLDGSRWRDADRVWFSRHERRIVQTTDGDGCQMSGDGVDDERSGLARWTGSHAAWSSS
jgi:hypothetical protein